jgi:hypothetical protein
MAPQVFMGMWIATSILGTGTGVIAHTAVKGPLGEGTSDGKSTFEVTKSTRNACTITGTTTASTNTRTIRAKTKEMGMVTGMGMTATSQDGLLFVIVAVRVG